MCKYLVSLSQLLPSHGGPPKLQTGRTGAELVVGSLRSPADYPGLALPKEKKKSLVTCRQLIQGAQLYVQCLCANHKSCLLQAHALENFSFLKAEASLSLVREAGLISAISFPSPSLDLSVQDRNCLTAPGRWLCERGYCRARGK